MEEQLINPFLKDSNSYKRDINPLKHYAYQCAYYLHVMTDQPLEDCGNWIKNKIKTKGFEGFTDPVVEYLLRGDNYDRELVKQPLTKLINDIMKNKEIMAPSMTTYKNISTEKSLLSVSIDTNVKKRGVAKKKMFAHEAEQVIAKKKNDEAKAAEEYTKWFFSEKTQAAVKISNNSISGMHNSAANPLFNPSSHSSLTSNCRITTGYGNANNEKLLTGNRHYWNANVTLANIISIVAHSDYKKIDNFIKNNNFHLPTAQETMEVVEYSTKMYWRNSVERTKIVEFINKLSPLQRAAFVYTGDLFHIRKFNEEYIRGFIKQLIIKVDDITHRTQKDVKGLFEDHLVWAHHICASDMKGRGKNYSEIEGTPVLATLYSTAVNIGRTLHDYNDFVDTFLMTDNIPASVGHFPDSIRRSALISDTDSTIFTVQEWQQWYCGALSFDDEAISVASTMIALASQSIGHVLSVMSTNAGIDKSMIRRIMMKNEYYFPVGVPTRVAKHYFAANMIQEGNVKEKLEYEIKGVHLKSSNAPPFVNVEAKRLMMEIIETIMKGEKISLVKILKDVTTMENRVMASLLKGEGTFFRSGQIQTLSSYKAAETPEKTNYFQYMIWNEVFAPKYGSIEPPPYAVYKLSTAINSPTLTEEWLDKMVDQELAERMRVFMNKHGRKNFGTFWIPKSFINQHGLPLEMQDAIGARHMVAGVCKVFYIILETLGYYGLNDKETNMCMDYYDPHEMPAELTLPPAIIFNEDTIDEEDEGLDDM